MTGVLNFSAMQGCAVQAQQHPDPNRFLPALGSGEGHQCQGLGDLAALVQHADVKGLIIQGWQRCCTACEAYNASAGQQPFALPLSPSLHLRMQLQRISLWCPARSQASYGSR